MLADALRRLRAWLAGEGEQVPPELFELERRAAVAMAACTCGHPWHRHEHYYRGTDCSSCRCERFRPAEPVRPVTGGGDQTSLVQVLLIRARVALWTRDRRDHRRV